MKKLLFIMGFIFISNHAYPCDTTRYTDPNKFISDFENGKCEKGYIYTVDYFFSNDNGTLSRHNISASKINSMTMTATIAIVNNQGIANNGYTTNDYNVIANLPKDHVVAYAFCDFTTSDKTLTVWLENSRDENNCANDMARLNLIGKGKGSLLHIRYFSPEQYGIMGELVRTSDDEGFHKININHVNF